MWNMAIKLSWFQNWEIFIDVPYNKLFSSDNWFFCDLLKSLTTWFFVKNNLCDLLNVRLWKITSMAYSLFVPLFGMNFNIFPFIFAPFFCFEQQQWIQFIQRTPKIPYKNLYQQEITFDLGYKSILMPHFGWIQNPSIPVTQ